jgi:hypothetical protein
MVGKEGRRVSVHMKVNAKRYLLKLSGIRGGGKK